MGKIESIRTINNTMDIILSYFKLDDIKRLVENNELITVDLSNNFLRESNTDDTLFDDYKSSQNFILLIPFELSDVQFKRLGIYKSILSYTYDSIHEILTITHNKNDSITYIHSIDYSLYNIINTEIFMNDGINIEQVATLNKQYSSCKVVLDKNAFIQNEFSVDRIVDSIIMVKEEENDNNV